jgi:hypothetical protein
VKVRYSEENGKQVAQTVQVEGAATKTARAETAPKTPKAAASKK